MSGELAVSILLKLNDQGSGAAARALQTITRALKETGDVARSTSAAAISAFQKLGSARETLGIRAEKAIQNEIRQTEAAYQRLAASGQTSARELGRAQDAMRQKVAGLRQELEGVKTSAGGAGSAMTRALAIAGGLAAGKAVLSGPVSRTMQYSMELAHVSNTLYANRSVAERIAAKSGINEAVMKGLRGNGGTRDESLAALKTLGASGEFGADPAAAFAMLPTVMKAAAATGTDATQMANIAIKARQNMGLTDTNRVFGMAAKGGIEGQFELRDMAKWLPQQMAFTSRAGLRGDSGFATIVALNQMSMRTAGTADEAGNNVKNFLAKVNSPDTANDAKKMNIDLAGTLAAAQAKGVGGVDAFLNLIEQTMAKDPRIVSLRRQAKTATGDDLRANLDAQKGILEGTAIGKWLQDMQALGPAVAVLADRDRYNKIQGNILGERDTIGSLHSVVAAEAEFKTQQAAAEAANSMQNALNGVNPLLGSMASGIGSLMQDFPVLSAALSGSTLAATALAAAATVAAGALTLLGGGATAGAAGGALGVALSKGGALLGAAFGAPGFIATGLGVGAYATYKALNGQDASNPASGVADGVVSWATGRKESLGGLLYDMTHGDEFKKATDSVTGMSYQAVRPPANQTINLNIDGQLVTKVVNDHNGRMAQRH